MPDLSASLLALLVFPLLLGAILGWFARGSHAKREKYALSVGWQEQLSAQKTEHNRIAEQNKNLVAQVGKFQASRKDIDARVKKNALALREAQQQRESAEKELEDARIKLVEAAEKLDRLKQNVHQSITQEVTRQDALREKDEKIFKLSRELDGWQSRLPPLLEKFRERNLEAQQLEVELEQARSQLAELAISESNRMDETTIESIEDLSLSADLAASNEQYGGDQDDRNDEEQYEEQHEDRCFDLPLAEIPLAVNGLSHDDLKQIKGVGPAIEKTLNDLGIYRFDQIASMDEIEIDRVAQELRGFQSRIYREDWIGQARLLQVERASPAH